MDFSPASLDQEFPSRRHGIHFNHAAVAPLPQRAIGAMAEYARVLSQDGSLAFRDSQKQVEAFRRLAARLIGASQDAGGASSISIVPNTTAGLSMMAQGLPWQPGNEIITTSSEFPANLTPWLSLERLGVTVRRIQTRDGAFSVEDVIQLTTPRTRLVAVSLVSFHTGFLAPAQEIGAFCKSRGIFFGLDAIQAAGVIPIDVTSSNVDFLSADGHKWMLGPEGCGLLYTRPGFRRHVNPPPGWANLDRRIGTFAANENPAYLENGRKFEPGALPMPGLAALSGSLSLILETGLETISRRVREILFILKGELENAGFTPLLFHDSPHAGILAARPPAGRDARSAAAFLEQNRVAVSAREGLLRFSPHFGNDASEAREIGRLLSQWKSEER